MSNSWTPFDRQCMRQALELAKQGQGRVEPNPMVGCVIAREDRVIGQGYHGHFGGPHAEIEALRQTRETAEATAGATMYVTLEPCCHHGKTPPCSQAILEAGIGRVVVAMRDPFPKVDGGGIRELEKGAVRVELGLLEPEARRLNGPFLKLVQTGHPWIIAKWAMTLCGKTATRTGSSRWISGEASREVVHRLRSRLDAIGIGRRTAELDDPLLTVRGVEAARTPLRLVVDTHARLALETQLVQTAGQVPLLIAVGEAADRDRLARLADAGAEVFVCPGEKRAQRLEALLLELGRRQMTNVLFEGGGQLVGSLFDHGCIDEVHVFLAPKLVGGTGAVSPIGGQGIADMADAIPIDGPEIQVLGSDVYLHGPVRKSNRES